MKNNKTNTLKSSRFAALKLAEIKATDKEDMSACVADMQKFASLSSDEAKVVAGALRAKYLPSIARKAGLDEEAIVNLDEGEESASFAEDLNKDHDVEDFSMEDNEDDVMGDDDEDLDIDLDDDNGEDDDDDIATFEIEVPADMLEAAQKAVQEALDKVLGGNSDVETDFDDEDDDVDTSDDEDMAEEPEMHTEEEDMDKKTLAARRAMRNELLKKVAAEEAEYPSAESFKYNDGLAQYEPAVDYPTMQMEDSAGNSLKDENPTFDKTKVPTNNPGSLAFPESMDVVHMSGGEKTLEYVVDWKKLENPSEGIDVETPEIPTQMDLAPRKATASEKHDVVCQDCKSSLRLSQEEIDADVPCPHCDKKKAEKEAATVNFSDLTEKQRAVSTGVGDAEQSLESLKSLAPSASVEKARITTSYSCASKLAIAGIISMDEVDVYAEQMLNDNLKTDAMLRQTKLLLKAAQTSVERVASAAAEKMNVRTASTVGISTSPALSVTNSAALDIQNALKGTWSMPKIED
jgi:hypothetical protein